MKLINLIALEDNETKQTAETEVVIYSRITEIEGLKEASRIEQQIQLEASFHNGVPCRVRKTTVQDKTEYHFTYKLKSESNIQEGLVASEEFTVQVDSDFFEGFKQIAVKKLEKTRYVFNSTNVELTLFKGEEKQIITIPNVEYEVDVYIKTDGSVSEWCKIDIEIDNVINFLSKEHPDLEDFKLFIKVSHLPFKPTETILTSIANGEQKAFIEQLWQNEFNQVVS